jgi:hypothetical protein
MRSWNGLRLQEMKNYTREISQFAECLSVRLVR